MKQRLLKKKQIAVAKELGQKSRAFRDKRQAKQFYPNRDKTRALLKKV
jgi:hypothetical protein